MTAELPLAGVRILHLASLGPAPYGVMLLADLGADVIVVDRVERQVTSVPAASDPRRRGQRSIAVDLRNPKGVEIVRDLARRTDVFVEGMRPGVAERLGLGPSVLAEDNPTLIYVRMTGWGQEGPDSMRAGHDINYVAATGVLAALGRPGETPPVPLNLLGDYAGGGLFMAFEILAALWARRDAGRGMVIDAAIVDGVASLTGPTLGMLHAGRWGERGSNAFDGSRPWYRTYATADHRYMAVGAIEPKFYAAFLQTIGLDPAAWSRTDSLDVGALTLELETRFAGHDQKHWISAFREVDACVTPVLNFDEAMDASAARARSTYIEIDGVPQPRPLPRWSAGPPPVPTAPPEPGRDTLAVLRELGRDAVQIERLMQSGCVAGNPSNAGALA
jgi:alpha-methylacyl-CoA racemase